MATSDALWIQGTDVEPENRPQYTGKLLRQLITAIYTEGVLDGGVVSEDSGGASMDVDVSALVATVDGDDESGQGTYMVFKDATTVTIGAAPGSNSRYDIVIAQVNDEQAGGAEGDNVEITSIAGTASSSPVAPDVPDSAILLATIGPITSSTTSITDDLIADSRSMATLRHDVVDEANVNDAAITADKIASDAVTETKIANGSVAEAKIATGAVTTNKLGAGAVVNSKIESRTIEGSRLALNTITSSEIGPDAVNTSELANAAVTLAKLDITTGTIGNSGNGVITYWRLGTGTGALVVAWVSTVNPGPGSSGLTMPSGSRPAAAHLVPAVNSSGAVEDVTIGTNGILTLPAGYSFSTAYAAA